ncbi:MAG: sugar transferase [Bacteroidetes bacterium]|nr:sugar transferase [Bacteroidota bacterium]
MNKTKRIFDVLFAVILLVLLFVPSLIICLIIYIQTKQNPFFIQERGLTLETYRFRIIKFRTLKKLSENDLSIRRNNMLHRPYLQEKVFPVGKFLRKTGLDELPQLINIIKGEMSIVGPRPLDLIDLKNIKINYPCHYKIRKKLNIKPGLSGFWQITRNEKRSIEYLIKADEYYKENQSFLFDVNIIIYSFYILFKGQNKDAILCKSRINRKLNLKTVE